MYARTPTHAPTFLAIAAAFAVGSLKAQEPVGIGESMRRAEAAMERAEMQLAGVGQHLEALSTGFEGKAVAIQASLEAAEQQLGSLDASALRGIGASVAATELALQQMAVGREATSRAISQRASAPVRDRDLMQMPAEPWVQQDPGDSIYRSGRTQLNRSEYRSAARSFAELRSRHPRSGYVPDSYYWEAFARNRLGSTDQLRTALELLQTQAERYPDAATARDGRVLATRIRGRLAQMGDAESAETIAELAPEREAAERDRAAAERDRAPRYSEQEPEDDIRLIALQALLNMDAERAMPILKQIMERRDAGSEELRRHAVFIISQKHSSETTDILLDAAQNDPDPEVRQQAVFFLSQVRDERAVDALSGILASSQDADVQEAALFALSQHRSERAAQALREYAGRSDVSADSRQAAIFGLSQHPSPENQQFLRDLYGQTNDRDLKEQILHSVSQMRGQDNQRWLLQIATNPSEDMDLRKTALFWAGQSGHVPVADLAQLYDSADDPEFQGQLIFVLGQRNDPEAVDKLMAIARDSTDRELQKTAIFWLSQSRDPRVAEFLLEIIK